MTEIDKQFSRTISAAAAAASFVAITQLATRDALVPSQLVAIGCFSITLPVFATIAALPSFYEIKDNSDWEWVFVLITALVGITFLVGIASLLWTFGWYFALIFAVASVASVVFGLSVE